MFGLFNGFLGITDFFDSIADSFLNMWDIIDWPISQAMLVFESLGSISIFPSYLMYPLFGVFAILIVLNIVRLLNYLPLW